MSMLSTRAVLLFCAAVFCVVRVESAQFYNDWSAEHFSDLPGQSGPFADADQDGQTNLVEFAFGTDPRLAGDFQGLVIPRFASANGLFGVEVWQRQGHQAGVQINLRLSADLVHWTWPWWQRSLTSSQPSDPPGSVREVFTTYLLPTNAWFVRSSVQLIEAGAEAAKYYVATNGSDSNPGTTTNAPFATLSKAAGLASAGDLIYVRGGTYHWTAQVSLSRSGSAAQPIRARAYPGERPIFDFTGESAASAGISLSGNWWQLYNLEIAHAGHNGIKVTGSSNIVERCIVHASGDTGIHITSGNNLASYNLISNCDSYRNYDPPIGGNADGFTAKFVLGPGNVFSGCRSWNNSDDGWDLWEATNTVVIQNCTTFSNGFNVFDYDPSTNSQFNGNGNGFKLGGNYYFGPHRISHCVSFGNKANGYDQNNNLSGLTVDNNTAWANGGANFNLNHGTNITPHVIRNNLSVAGHSADSFRSGSLLTNNSWQVILPSASASDLLSVDAALPLALRRDNGGLPETPFLRPLPNGRLVDKGINLGEPFQATAPDLGAFETPAW